MLRESCAFLVLILNFGTEFKALDIVECHYLKILWKLIGSSWNVEQISQSSDMKVESKFRLKFRYYYGIWTPYLIEGKNSLTSSIKVSKFYRSGQ